MSFRLRGRPGPMMTPTTALFLMQLKANRVMYAGQAPGFTTPALLELRSGKVLRTLTQYDGNPELRRAFMVIYNLLMKRTAADLNRYVTKTGRHARTDSRSER
jgi:hypothetical protein